MPKLSERGFVVGQRPTMQEALSLVVRLLESGAPPCLFRWRPWRYKRRSGREIESKVGGKRIVDPCQRISRHQIGLRAVSPFRSHIKTVPLRDNVSQGWANKLANYSRSPSRSAPEKGELVVARS
jgi:hypothetical protein